MLKAVIPFGMTEHLLVTERSDNMRKKLAATLLCMCMALTLLPVSASAATTSYNLWVSGVEVTSANSGSITGTGITGTVSYNAFTNTLTLDGAAITGVHGFGTQTGFEGTIDSACIYYDGPSDLTINVVGNNTITGQAAQASSYGICSRGERLKFTGSGSLTVRSAAITCECSGVNHWSVPIYASGDIEIDRSATNTFAIEVISGGADDVTRPILPETGNLVLNDRSAVYGDSGESTTAYTATNVPNDLYGKKYMKIAQGVTPTYNISISPAPVTFTNVPAGYDAVTPQTVTVTNAGTSAAGELSVSLSDGSGKFTLSQETINVAASGSDTFTVTPVTGLSAGTHTATVNIKKDGVFTKTLGVRFTVTAGDQIPTPPTTPTTPTTPTARPAVTITYENGDAVTAPKVGETLKAKVENAPENTTLTYLWCYNDGTVNRAFPNATNETYTLGADAVGKKVLVQVRDDNTQQGEPLCQYVIGTAVAAADGNTPDVTPTPPATGGHNRVFHVDAEKAESPKTADTGVMLYAALSLASLTGTAWWSRKRK